MENKIIAMLVVIMGSLLVETEAMGFQECFTGCTSTCGANGLTTVTCPFTCFALCIPPPSEPVLQEIDQTGYFCKLGCATNRCVPSSSIEDKDHAEKVSVCVDSCSDMCSNKN
ncbi:hypothetical protein Bca52824_062591 [Brassica carinata]|uniref:Thionin-like protein 2 n=1 Tax=Brassica carinata TaxID=52824 RepID=A0A8X7U8B9_BRACI|nr:hypothetical protein Bca52824_062591 [Brassica carinata]